MSRLVRELFSRRWWWVTFIVVGLMIVLARLGVWQLNRLEQRRAQNIQLESALAAPAVDLGGDVLIADPDALKNRLVTATGEFDFDKQINLVQQKWQEQHGVHLITPLVLQGGETAVLVDRGWIPDSEVVTAEKFDISGTVTVAGRGALSQILSGNRGKTTIEYDDEWFRVDIEAIQAQMPYDLLPIYVIQSPTNENRDLPYRSEPLVDLTEGPHLSYAIQWFIFSIGLGIGYILYVNKSMKENK